MMQERIGPAGKGRADVQLGGEHGSYTEEPAKNQAQRTVLKDDLVHLVGGARVVVDRKQSEATVWLANAPWGWGTMERVFLNPGSRSVDRYASDLLKRVRLAGEREAERRKRIKAAKANGGAA